MTINSKGYDSFIGREVFLSGHSNFVTLDLKSGGSMGFRTLDTACDVLIDDLKNGKKVMLYENPGECEEENRSELKIKQLLDESFLKVGRNGDRMIVRDTYPKLDDAYTLSSRRYEVFTQEQMTELERLYEKQKPKGLPNPFLKDKVRKNKR